MPLPGAAAHGLAERYRLALLEAPTRGVLGERLGRGTGASMEFQDRRTYSAGDDVRHLDWRAFARTDQLMVRQYREEIVPRLDLVVDASRSMALDAQKAQCATDVAALLAFIGRAEGLAVSVVRIGSRPEPLALERLEREGLEFDGRVALDRLFDGLGPLLRPGSARVIVSDFLFPHDARLLLRPIAARAGGLGVVQVLAREDREPRFEAALRLTDSEDDSTLDLVVDRVTRERYGERLTRLTKGLDEEARRLGARFASLIAGPELAELARATLVPGGILAPA